MPHGGYHGNVVMGGQTIQKGVDKNNDGNYEILGSINQPFESAPPQPNNVQAGTGVMTGSREDGFEYIPQEPIVPNIENQAQAVQYLNQLGTGVFSDPEKFSLIANQLKTIPAVTTDMNESRNMYQMLVNDLLRTNRGAQLINFPSNLKRVGDRMFMDPSKSQGFFADVGSLFTGENPSMLSLSELPSGGIMELPNYGDAGQEFAEDVLGAKDYGALLETLLTPAPFKLAKFLYDKSLKGVKEFPDFSSSTVKKVLKPIDKLTELIDSIGDDDKDEDEISKLIDSISDDDGSFEVAELTDKQKDFIKKQSFAIKEGLKTPRSVFETINNPNLGIFKKPFFGIGGQDPTTVEEFNEYLKSLDQTMPTIIT